MAGWGKFKAHILQRGIYPFYRTNFIAPLRFIRTILPSARDGKEKLTFSKDNSNAVKYEEEVSLLLGSLKYTTKIWQ